MFSATEYRLILQVASLNCKACIIYADFKNQVLCMSTSKRKYVIKVLFLAVCLFLCCWSAFRVHYFSLYDETYYRAAKLAWNITFCGAVVAGSSWHLTFHWMNDILIELFNHLIKCVKRAGILGTMTKHRKLFILFQHLLNAISFGASIFAVTVESHFIWVISNEYVGYCWILLSIPVGAMMVWFVAAGLALLQFLIMYMYVYYLLVVMGISNLSVAINENANVALLNQVIHEYRALCILTNMFNNSYGRVVIPNLKLFISTLAIFTLVVGVKIRSEVDSYILSFLFISMSLYTGALVNFAASMSCSVCKISCEFIQAFQKQRLNNMDRKIKKYIQIHARSFTPLRITVGHFYFMENEATLTLTGFMINGAANVLTGFRELS